MLSDVFSVAFLEFCEVSGNLILLPSDTSSFLKHDSGTNIISHRLQILSGFIQQIDILRKRDVLRSIDCVDDHGTTICCVSFFC